MSKQITETPLEDGEIADDIDLNVIPRADLEEASGETVEQLETLGVSVYDPDIFERSVLRQFDEAIINDYRSDLAKVEQEIESLSKKFLFKEDGGSQNETNANDKEDEGKLVRKLRTLIDRKETIFARLAPLEEAAKESKRDVPPSSNAQTVTARQRLQAQFAKDWAGKDGVELEGRSEEREQQLKDRKELSLFKSKEGGIGSRFGPFGTEKLREVNIPTMVSHQGSTGVRNQLIRLAKTERKRKRQAEKKAKTRKPNKERQGRYGLRSSESAFNDDLSKAIALSMGEKEADEVYQSEEEGEEIPESDSRVSDDDLASSLIESSDGEGEESESDIDGDDVVLMKLVRAEQRRDPDCVDDGDSRRFRHRVESWNIEEKARRQRINLVNSDGKNAEDDVVLDGGYRIAKTVDESLFPYQRSAVNWLWDLHCQHVGGILGDEMGLGKTVEIAAFLSGLHYSGLLGPSILICPATVMSQWVRELHKWWPPMRTILLHESGYLSRRGVPRHRVVDSVIRNGDLLISTYAGVRNSASYLQKYSWDYFILDEGHKIRSTDASITTTVKRFSTSHRIIMTGAPIQNNLAELWSLFDFVYPGKLGTLPVFQAQFVHPITLGGYANATAVQVQTAYQCAVVLRGQIAPYMLRRLKKDVNLDLPGKTEQVLFCELTEVQRATYEHFLDSPDLQAVFTGRRNLLYGIDVLRKICNHPDLLSRDDPDSIPADYGHWDRSGKLCVVDRLLDMWASQDHRVLFFAQTRQMLDIIESFVHGCGYSYLRMDGTTPISGRMVLIDKFNNDDSVFVFLLTSKVGGLGTNLTGADRVLIFDPDWNPSTDLQARERAWRIGQSRHVVIYRLITAGTIEEKIYHRQIFKQFMTNKILRDPRQKRFFTSHDLRDLFSLSSRKPGSQKRSVRRGNRRLPPTETSLMFDQSTEVKPRELARELTTESAPDTLGAGSHDRDLFSLLLGPNAVTTIMRHDKIFETCTPERAIIEKEANRVAQEALATLNQYLDRAQKESNAVIVAPHHSNRFGKAVRHNVVSNVSERLPGSTISRPKSNDQGPISSVSILGNLRTRSNLSGLATGHGGGDVNDNDVEESCGISEAWKREVSASLYEFLSTASERITTQQIINHFQNKLKNVTQKHAFRAMLKQLAIFQDNSWRLL